jgi:hypothetical protein
MRLIPLLLVLCSCGPALVPLRRPAADPLESIGWLAGSWTGEESGRVVEEHWTQPSGGAMIGMSRTLAGGRMTEFEFLRIEAERDGIVYVASPGGAAPTEFRTRALPREGENRIVFRNPEHDFPKRIEYRLFEGQLHVRVEGGGRAREWTWDRAEVETD